MSDLARKGRRLSAVRPPESAHNLLPLGHLPLGHLHLGLLYFGDLRLRAAGGQLIRVMSWRPSCQVPVTSENALFFQCSSRTAVLQMAGKMSICLLSQV